MACCYLCVAAPGTYRRESIFHSQNRDASAKMKACREKKQQTRSVGWFQVTLSPCRSPRGLLLVLRRCARHQMERINFPLTKSRRVRKDEGISRKKIAGKLGRVVVRNMEPMPLTSRPAGSRASLGSLPHLFSQIVLQIFFQKNRNDKVRGIGNISPQENVE